MTENNRNNEREERIINRANKIFRRNLDTFLDKTLQVGAIGATIYTTLAEFYEGIHNYPVGSHLPIMFTAIGTFTIYQAFR
ncbi:MAG: hypothetical protein AABY03_00340, partial [Nanoarchaeota archaeon]